MRVCVWAAAAGLVVAAMGAGAQSKADKSEAEIKAEDAQALGFYEQQNFVAALPLLEDLHAQRPQVVAYTEELAFALVGQATRLGPDEAKAARARARKLALEAKAGGDNSNLVQTMLEDLPAPGEEQPAASTAPGQELVDKGEAAFAGGDLPAALGFYEKALEVNPQLYVAALFAGDAEFKMDHPAEAGKWFAKAIAIDPNTETAYRYWGDTLDKAGEHERAKEEFIQAIVAQPYQRGPRVGLKQWADRNHAMLAPPPITLPDGAAKGKDGKINITIHQGSKEDDPEMALAMSYGMESALWQGDEFKKHFPKEATYRHSLLEEATNIRGMLTVARELKIPSEKLSKSTQLLMELDAKGMLECWILLDNPDQGIAQDYAAYRDAHRALLGQYIAQYDVHAM